jgi:hypothetical protein
VKLADDVIEEAFRWSATVCLGLFHALRSPLAFCRANHQFEFQKRGQLFIGMDNEPLFFAPLRVCNPDRSPAGINR